GCTIPASRTIASANSARSWSPAARRSWPSSSTSGCSNCRPNSKRPAPTWSPRSWAPTSRLSSRPARTWRIPPWQRKTRLVWRASPAHPPPRAVPKARPNCQPGPRLPSPPASPPPNRQSPRLKLRHHRRPMRELPVDAKVICTDGDAGWLTDLVVSQATRAVTHIVVRENTGDGREFLVPLDRIADSSREEVRLSCSRAELTTFPEFTSTHYVAASSPEAQPVVAAWEME